MELSRLETTDFETFLSVMKSGQLERIGFGERKVFQSSVSSGST